VVAAVLFNPFQAIAGFPWAVLAIIAVLSITYLAIVAVALFHPCRTRRADARQILDRHFLSRRRL
jgi:hypothetical protein